MTNQNSSRWRRPWNSQEVEKKGTKIRIFVRMTRPSRYLVNTNCFTGYSGISRQRFSTQAACKTSVQFIKQNKNTTQNCVKKTVNVNKKTMHLNKHGHRVEKIWRLKSVNLFFTTNRTSFKSTIICLLKCQLVNVNTLWWMCIFIQSACLLAPSPLFTVRSEVAKVMFLQVCVCPRGGGV